MSHVNTYSQTKILDIEEFLRILQDQNYNYTIGNIDTKLFQTRVQGVVSFNLPGWVYPLVVKETGEIVYDNFEGSWGSMDTLGELIQTYNKSITMQGIDYSEWDNVSVTTLENGDIEIEMMNY